MADRFTLRRDGPTLWLDHAHGRLALATLLGALCAGTTACGGGDNTGRAGLESEQAALSAAPLIAGDGTVLPTDPQAFPADPSVRTQQRRYATRQQAGALEQAMSGDVLVLNVDCCGAAMAEQGVNIAFGIQAGHDYSDDVPVLVGSTDLRTAAMVVDRLATAGMSRVWLVTQ